MKIAKDMKIKFKMLKKKQKNKKCREIEESIVKKYCKFCNKMIKLKKGDEKW